MKFDFNKKYELAKKAYDNAYAIYSHFQVGAIVILKDGNYISGSNIENASYGLSNCAERSALFATYSAGYRRNDIEELVIMGKSDNLVFPCGACRQVIAELMLPEAMVTLINLDKKTQSFTVAELLPYAFSKDDLDV